MEPSTQRDGRPFRRPVRASPLTPTSGLVPNRTSMQEESLLSGMPQPSLTPDQLVGRNILLATDFSECSAGALDYALGIASRYESQLCLFHCIDPAPYY